MNKTYYVLYVYVMEEHFGGYYEIRVSWLINKRYFWALQKLNYWTPYYTIYCFQKIAFQTSRIFNKHDKMDSNFNLIARNADRDGKTG